MKRLITLIALGFCLCGCNTFYFEPEFTRQEHEGMIPQEGDVIEVEYSYVQVETKFQPGTAYLTFRYRVLADGQQFSYAVVNGSGYPPLEIVIPANDSYSERTIRVEISAGSNYDRYPSEWGEWYEVFSGSQACLAEDEQLMTPALEAKGIRISKGELSFDLEDADNGSVMPLKTLLADGSLVLEANVYSDFISVNKNEYTELFSSRIPLNHGDGNRKYGLYLHDSGFLLLTNNSDNINYQYSTLLGYIRDTDINLYRTMFTGSESQKVTLSLE